MKKAQMIREVVSEKYLQTNLEIQKLVLKTFGVIVGFNEIINTLGSFRERQKSGTLDPDLRRKAKEFVRLAGDTKNAVRLLYLVENRA